MKPSRNTKGVDGVLDAVAAALGAPLQEQDVVLVDGGLEVPGGLRDLAEELGEGLADAVLAAEHAGGVMKMASSL
jgi:hypothetical protein